MHSFNSLFILFFSNICTSFDVVKIIEVWIEIFLNLRFNSNDGVVEIFVSNMLWRDRLFCLLRLFVLLLCLLLFLWLVIVLLLFRWLLIGLTLGVLHFRLRLLFRIRILAFKRNLLAFNRNLLAVDCGCLWSLFLLIFLIWFSKELLIMLFNFLMKFKFGFDIVQLLELYLCFIICVFFI